MTTALHHHPPVTPVALRAWLTLGLFVLLVAGCARTRPPAVVHAAVAPPRPSLLLADGGKAVMPIVIAADASASTRGVAAELAGYLRRISGASFEVQSGNGTAGIVLGTLAEFPDPALVAPLQIRDGIDGKEAYAIRTEPGRLRLIGATDLGVSHAAFRLLQALGCRWFFPAKEWEIVPPRPHLTVGLDETSRPAILSRRIGYGYGFMRDPKNPEDSRRSNADFEAWCRHNLMGDSFHVYASHAWQAIIAKHKAEFDAHPEYYAMVDGKRPPSSKFEVANPAVRRMAVDWALDYFRAHPDADMVSLEPSDGGGFSESPESTALGSVSDRVFGLANEAARAVQKEFPGKMVGLLAYGWHSDPPDFDLEPNVYVERTAGFTYSKHSAEELTALWEKRSRHVGIYEYFSVWLWDWDLLPGGRGADTFYLRRKIRGYADAHAMSITAESSNSWGPNGRGYYLASKLMWNPDVDAQAVLDDFYAKAFGPAAPAMRRYYERLDPGGDPLLSSDLLARAYRDVDEASRLARARPDVQARLDDIKQYLHYNYLHWRLDRTKSEEERKALTLAILTHLYRTRYSYMNHWEAVRQWWTPRAAKEFDEPAWSFRDPTPDKAWRVAAPPTHEETEKAFREGLAYFQPEHVVQKSFSTDLVPVQFDTGPHIASVQQFQQGQRYALYSLHGEPLRLTLAAGLIAIYRGKPDARYTLTDAAGKEVAAGRLPLDGQKRDLTLTAPRAGLYFLDVDDSGAGWQIRLEADRAASVALSRTHDLRSAGLMQHMYFYVPRGTKTIDYYFRGKPHHVLGPDGKVVQEVVVLSDYVSVPVPPGLDGKVWSFSGLVPRKLALLDVPNYIAASPAALLVPREVARADGLRILTSAREGSPRR